MTTTIAILPPSGKGSVRMGVTRAVRAPDGGIAPLAERLKKGSHLKRATKLRLTVAVAALGALTAVVGGGAASASPDAKAADAAVITAQKEGKDIFFEGPKTVEQGQVLKFKSKTDPRK